MVMLDLGHGVVGFKAWWRRIEVEVGWIDFMVGLIEVVVRFNRPCICVQATLYCGSTEVLIRFNGPCFCVQATLYLGSTEVLIRFNRGNSRSDRSFFCRIEVIVGLIEDMV